LPTAIAALVSAAPPLLEAVVVVDVEKDAEKAPPSVDVDLLTAFPRLRRLGLNSVKITKPMPQLRELCCAVGTGVDPWIEAGGCPNLEELTLDCRMYSARVIPLLDAVPKLRRLRLLHLDTADTVVAELRRSGRSLELMDVSHSNVTDAGAALLADWPELQVVALRTPISTEMAARLAARVPAAVVSRSSAPGMFEGDRNPDGATWLHYRLAHDGREGLHTIPGIGAALYGIGSNHSSSHRESIGVPLLDACLTVPSSQRLWAWGWQNAANAHDRLGELDEAELTAREGLLRMPGEPNLYSTLIDSLRRAGRLADAVAVIPRAVASLTAPKGPGAHVQGRACCLADCMQTLQQAGRHTEVMRLATEHAEIFGERTDQRRRATILAILAMTKVSLGQIADAKTSLKLAKTAMYSAGTAPSPATAAILDHVKAVVALAQRTPNLDAALAALADAKQAGYSDWHFIAIDPSLAKLADLPAFRALVE
jgi:hypothetical protein